MGTGFKYRRIDHDAVEILRWQGKEEYWENGKTGWDEVERESRLQTITAGEMCDVVIVVTPL